MNTRMCIYLNWILDYCQMGPGRVCLIKKRSLYSQNIINRKLQWTTFHSLSYWDISISAIWTVSFISSKTISPKAIVMNTDSGWDPLILVNFQPLQLLTATNTRTILFNMLLMTSQFVFLWIDCIGTWCAGTVGIFALYVYYICIVFVMYQHGICIEAKTPTATGLTWSGPGPGLRRRSSFTLFHHWV